MVTWEEAKRAATDFHQKYLVESDKYIDDYIAGVCAGRSPDKSEVGIEVFLEREIPEELALPKTHPDPKTRKKVKVYETMVPGGFVICAEGIEARL